MERKRKKRKIVVEDSEEEENVSQVLDDDIIHEEINLANNTGITKVDSNFKSPYMKKDKLLVYKIRIRGFKSYRDLEEIGPFDEHFSWFDHL